METDTASNNGNDTTSNNGNDSPVLILNISYAVTPHFLILIKKKNSFKVKIFKGGQ